MKYVCDLYHSSFRVVDIQVTSIIPSMACMSWNVRICGWTMICRRGHGEMGVAGISMRVFVYTKRVTWQARHWSAEHRNACVVQSIRKIIYRHPQYLWMTLVAMWPIGLVLIAIVCSTMICDTFSYSNRGIQWWLVHTNY